MTMISVGLKDAETQEIMGSYEFASCPRVGETLIVRKAYMHRYLVEAVEHWPKLVDPDSTYYHAPIIVMAVVRFIEQFDV